MLFSRLQHEFDDVVIWGLGREGVSSLDVARGLFAPGNIFVSDANARAGDDFPGISFVPEAELVDFCRQRRCAVIKSPGISLYGEIAMALAEHGVALTSQLNLFLANRPAHVQAIGVTGTKGKSTSCSMIYHALEKAGKRAAISGNIGVPPLSVDLDKVDIVVVETSSYQAADLEYGFDIAVLLNLGFDHLDWHGDFETYQHDKLNLLRQSQAGLLILGPDAAMYADFDGRRAGASLRMVADGTAAADPGTITFNGASLPAPPQILGIHNRRNLCAALAVLEAVGVPPEAAIAALEDFRPLRHRLERVATREGVDFIDDGLATTPQACLAAAAIFNGRPLVLIIGGADRGQDYRFLAQQLAALPDLKACLLVPGNSAKLYAAIEAEGIAHSASECDSLATAVARGFEILKSGGGVVLMSPAAARGGGYENSETRGEAFRTAIAALPCHD